MSTKYPTGLSSSSWRRAAHAISGQRNLYLHAAGGFQEVATYSAEKLRAGNALDGPALVEAEDTTVLVGPGQRLWVDGFGNLRIDLPPAEGRQP